MEVNVFIHSEIVVKPSETAKASAEADLHKDECQLTDEEKILRAKAQHVKLEEIIKGK